MSKHSLSVTASDRFLSEYSSDDAVRRYTQHTAGAGINYLLKHEYGSVYLNTLRNYVTAPIHNGIRLLEFGCGGGMNLLHCLTILERERIPLLSAYGTDFSERLIREASEQSRYATLQARGKVTFLVARNEYLITDMMAGLCLSKRALVGSFHLIIGVNTFRYCYRLFKEDECARDIYDLLAPGGACVMIDMNRNFPMFRTRLRDRLTKPGHERYLPSLNEYAAVFARADLRIVEQRNFSWIPHSAGPALLSVCRTMAPLLDTLVPSLSMRSLVISKKPD